MVNIIIINIHKVYHTNKSVWVIFKLNLIKLQMVILCQMLQNVISRGLISTNEKKIHE